MLRRSLLHQRVLAAWLLGSCALAPPRQAEAQVAAAPQIELPRLVDGPLPPYPEHAVGEARVVLLVTLSAEGVVEEASVEKIERPAGEALEPGGDEAFASSALAIVRSYRFSPARRAGQAVRARVRVPLSFVPSVESSTLAPVHQSAPDVHEPAPAHDGDSHLEVTVHGDRPLRTESRAASDYFIHREALEAAPHLEGADVLRTVPGLTSFRGEGLGLAHSYTLRGFDSEHGQDIEFVVGSLPINLPSHIHGQGYADLGFLIGDVVDELRVSAGVSDPKQGDFAVAGSIDVGLGVDPQRRGLSLRSSFGSFDTFRQIVTWAPKESSRESFGAAQYTSTGGFGQNRAGQSASGLVQHRFGSGAVTYRFIGLVHSARADSAGVVRRDDVQAGVVCFHCVYPFATAEAQGTLSQRVMVGFFADYRGPEHATGTVGLWLGHDNFRTQQNYTGFLERSQSLSLTSGLGDLIEQRNKTNSLGLTGRYRTEAFEPFAWAHGTLEVGTDSRFDVVDQSQSLLNATVRNQIWDRRVDAAISAMDLGLWGDLDFQLGELLLLRFGARADVLSYEVDDRLGNRVSQERNQEAFLPGYRRSALGVAAGPRTSLEIRALPWLSLLAAYGEGYRSPQARLLEDGEKAPFTKVHSGDAGIRLRFGDPLELSVAGFVTRLSDDVAFDASEGSLARIGATERLGGTFYAISHPAEWMVTSLSLTYVRAVLLEPPPATAEQPDPPFVAGQAVPYVPPLVARVDSSVRRTLMSDLGGRSLMGRVGVGLSFLAGRPLPYGQTAVPVGLVDASLGLDWGVVQFSLEGYNLLNQSYAAAEYSFVSNWAQNQAPSRIPARHVAAGAPLSFLATIGVTL